MKFSATSITSPTRSGGSILATLFSCLLVLLTPGCVSRGAIQEVMLPYNVVLKTVIRNLPGGLRDQSQNGRELRSQYFSPRGLDIPLNEDDAFTSKDRAYAEVIILGSSRPYVLDVHVYRERKNKGSRDYTKVGDEPRLTKDLVERLKIALADRREGGNIIDDFRAF